MPGLVPPVVPRERWAAREQPDLHADGLLLRPWRAADVPIVVGAYEDPEIQRWHVRTMTPAEAAGWVRSWAESWSAGTGASWAVVEAGTVVGRTGVPGLELPTGGGKVGYWVVPGARGRGIAVRALDAVTRWAFTEIGLHRLEIVHSVANAASCRVALRAGFELDGTRRAAGLHADGWHDMHLHGRVVSSSVDGCVDGGHVVVTGR